MNTHDREALRIYVLEKLTAVCGCIMLACITLQSNTDGMELVAKGLVACRQQMTYCSGEQSMWYLLCGGELREACQPPWHGCLLPSLRRQAAQMKPPHRVVVPETNLEAVPGNGISAVFAENPVCISIVCHCVAGGWRRRCRPRHVPVLVVVMLCCQMLLKVLHCWVVVLHASGVGLHPKREHHACQGGNGMGELH